jgi:hypothetical protein
VSEKPQSLFKANKNRRGDIKTWDLWNKFTTPTSSKLQTCDLEQKEHKLIKNYGAPFRWKTRSHSNSSREKHRVFCCKKARVCWRLPTEILSGYQWLTILTDRPPLSAKLLPVIACCVVSAVDSYGSESWFSILQSLLFLPSSSSDILTRLSELSSRPTTSQKIWYRRESNPGPLNQVDSNPDR